MSENIPLTLGGGYGGNGLELYVGSASYSVRGSSNTFWWLVFDLANPTAEPLINVSSSSSSEVPATVLSMASQPNRLLCFSFNNVWSNHLPTGDLYTFLISAGADSALRRIEQIVEQSGSNLIDGAGYGLVASLDNSGEPGIEMMGLDNGILITCELQPMQINGHTVYTPVQLS